MWWFISRIAFPTRRESLLGSKCHLFSLPRQSRENHIANGSAGTTKPALFGCKCASKGYNEHLMNRQSNGHVYTCPSSGIAGLRRKQQGTYLNDVTSQRSRCLKESLSKTLVAFYPQAGKIKDNLHIECNDDGVYYVETRTNIGMLDFLRKPENEFMNQLCPFHPDSTELLSKSYPIMVQVNIFDCGGIAICLGASHKIFDGLSVSTFMQSWAATTRESTLELELLVNKISNSIGTMNADFVESINGENGIQKLMGALKDFHEVFYDPNSMAECIYISSICKTGFYEADFGWGKPIWTCIARGNGDLHGLGNIAHLMETKSGDGIEALVTMKEEYMATLQKNQELLHYASLNRSPLDSS
ncbi:unnamed protein product [Coffea canephora]|uniref:Uncharacterized protein n=1 Tax=Coffea canephora TaxID=49390 RepID=A0A068V693_COFCA|nr:unnamed protein product [Coffea canephora]